MGVTVEVRFLPGDRVLHFESGEMVLEAAAHAGFMVRTPCGGAGTCGKCKVRFIKGSPDACSEDVKFFSDEEIKAGWRLACKAFITSDCEIEVPKESVFEQMSKIQEKSNVKHKAIPDLKESIILSKGDNKDIYAVAFDIGTTTVAAVLVDMVTGDELGVVSSSNPQSKYGDDVISRVQAGCESDKKLVQLQKLIIDCCNLMIRQLVKKVGIEKHQIYYVSFAGNSAMEMLLCGVNPVSLSVMPFEPDFQGGVFVSPVELGIELGDRVKCYIFPLIGGFVGGDITSCILSSGMTEMSGPILLIDIGTNGEIVLFSDAGLHAASTAAGPAFEGARISCGMRAVSGAIDRIVIEDDIKYSVLEDCEAVGICGSGLIDLLAELLRIGVVQSTGLISTPAELSDLVSDKIKGRIESGENGRIFRLSDKVVFTQKDVREMQLAIGAMRAGVIIMMKRANVTPEELAEVFIAGGFGSFIHRDKAQRVGLLPIEVPHDKISYIGNASLAGAKWVVLSSESLKKASLIVADSEHVDLSSDLNFQMEFSDAMIFPSNLS